MTIQPRLHGIFINFEKFGGFGEFSIFGHFGPKTLN